MIRHSILAAALAAPLTIPCPASAQSSQQTPENAQRFLATVAGQVRSSSPTSLGTNFWSPSIPLTTHRPNPDVCITWWEGREPVMNNLTPIGVDWKNVAEVRHAEGSTVILLAAKTGGSEQEFTLGSSSLAARAAYAMEFLRQHCDPAADTGF